jgi:glycosidase
MVHAELDETFPRAAVSRICIELLSGAGEVLQQTAPCWSRTMSGSTLLRYGIALPAGAERLRFSSAKETWPLPQVEQTAVPHWLDQGCIYSIFIDRWYRGSNRVDPRAMPRTARSARSTFYGGDLDGIRHHLDAIAELGVTAIALTPLFLSETPHRYDAHDFACIDSRLGGEAALRRLVAACHERGLAVVLDAAFAHCHADHSAFRDLIEHQTASRYRDWFQIKRFPVSIQDPQSYRHYWDMPYLPLTNLASPSLQAHLLSVVDHWLALGIDGLRLDAADMVPDSFWQALRTRVRRRTSPPVLIAECVSEPSERYLDNDLADIVFDFPVYSEFLHWFIKEMDSFEGFAERMEAILHRRGPQTSQRRLWFLDCHDTNRFVTEATFYWRLRLALLFLLLRTEPLWFYYGTELGLTSRQRVCQPEAAWPDRMPMPIVMTQTRTKPLVQRLLRYRKQLRGQGFGEALLRQDTGYLIIYERSSDRQILTVVLNFTEAWGRLPDDLHSGECLLRLENELTSEEPVALAPHSGCVLLRPKEKKSDTR